MEQERALQKIMILDIKTNPNIPPEAYGDIAMALWRMWGAGFDEGRQTFLENQISHPVGIVNISGEVIREFPSLKSAMHYTKDCKNTIINAIKHNRRTKRGYRYVYTGDRKSYKTKT